MLSSSTISTISTNVPMQQFSFYDALFTNYPATRGPPSKEQNRDAIT